MESTKSMSNFPSFLELLNEFHFLKGASNISLNLGPNFESILEKTYHHPSVITFMLNVIFVHCNYNKVNFGAEGVLTVYMQRHSEVPHA